MNPLLAQFLTETRETLEAIGEILLRLEDRPEDGGLLNDLFRLVHTLKGNSGLFSLPEMTRVLHAAEDLMDAVRTGRVPFGSDVTDLLLRAMDFVGAVCEQIEEAGSTDAGAGPRADEAAVLVEALVAASRVNQGTAPGNSEAEPVGTPLVDGIGDRCPWLLEVPEAVRMMATRRILEGRPLFAVTYRPADDCFYRGDDPFLLIRQTPERLWGRFVRRESVADLASYDVYRNILDYHVLSGADWDALADHYRYVMDQVTAVPVPAQALAVPQGTPEDTASAEDLIAELEARLARDQSEALAGWVQERLGDYAPDGWAASVLRWLKLLLDVAPPDASLLQTWAHALRETAEPKLRANSETERRATAAGSSGEGAATDLPPTVRSVLDDVLEQQREILQLQDDVPWGVGRLRAAAATLIAVHRAVGDAEAVPHIEAALTAALEQGRPEPLRQWLGSRLASRRTAGGQVGLQAPTGAGGSVNGSARVAGGDEGGVLRVDAAKIDRLMDLIGEMVVAQNALPYLAKQAELRYGVRELARDLKLQADVIHRIAMDLQDAIMQVRMAPMATVFRRFPRLVRDLARKLGKQVQLRLEGEDTAVDKTIMAALTDPLIHMVRNSLDHGIESPEERRAVGKPETGQLTLRAWQEGDRVLIEVVDDGRGIDPVRLKRKAAEKGLVDAAALDAMTDREAIQLIFLPGFSTADQISDLSGRGVGMDVVRSAVEKVGGTVVLESTVGVGTQLRLSLPISMALTPILVVESAAQRFGLPLESVVETVRLPEKAVSSIKQQSVVVLREQVVPLYSLNQLLQVPESQRLNRRGEMAIVVLRVGGDLAGMVVDEFRETMDVMVKPLPGSFSRLTTYQGAALLGDGTVLLVINPKELIGWH
jgi:two-component system chemotaxis sensor kinase CheA